jgi:hypothetical protein
MQRLEERVRKSEEDQVVHPSLAKVMIDAVGRRLVEGVQGNPVQLERWEDLLEDKIAHRSKEHEGVRL